jgi:hypothetical protein
MAEVIVEVRWLRHALGQAFDAGRDNAKGAEADYPDARDKAVRALALRLVGIEEEG